MVLKRLMKNTKLVPIVLSSTAILLTLPMAHAQSDTNQTACASTDSPAIQELRRGFNGEKINVLTFQNMASIFHALPVKAGGTVTPFEASNNALNFAYDYDGKTRAAADIFDRTYTNALLILKDGKIVHETYRNFTGANTQFMSMSTAKSITSILVGAAIADGHIKSVNDKVTDYVPALKGTSFDGSTVRDLLLMRSGVAREDNYRPEPGSKFAKLREEIMILNCRRSVDEALFVEKADAPGKTFRYSTLNTNILGWILEKATSKPLNVYMSERLWQPLGAEADGAFITDGPAPDGRATNGMGFNGVARDYARIGMMMLNEGRVGDRQIVPAAWVKESTVPVFPEPVAEGERHGYQYQWWTFTNSNAYVAIGLQGQYIYVDPDTRTVAVKFSYFPLGAEEPYAESEAFFRAVSKWQPR